MNRRTVTITEVDNGWLVEYHQTQGIPEQIEVYLNLADAESNVHGFLAAPND